MLADMTCDFRNVVHGMRVVTELSWTQFPQIFPGAKKLSKFSALRKVSLAYFSNFSDLLSRNKKHKKPQDLKMQVKKKFYRQQKAETQM